MSDIRTSQNRSPQEPKQSVTGSYVKGFTLIFFCLVTLSALSGFGYGRLNELWANTLRWLFGGGSYLLALLLGIQGVFILRARSWRTYLSWGQLLASELLILCLLALWTLNSNETLLLHADMLKTSGGLLGWTIAFFVSLFGITVGKIVLYLCMLSLLPALFKWPLTRIQNMLTNQRQRIKDWQISLQSPISNSSSEQSYSSAKTSNRQTRPLANQEIDSQTSIPTDRLASTIKSGESKRPYTQSSYSSSTARTRPLSREVPHGVTSRKRESQQPLQTQNRTVIPSRERQRSASVSRPPISASQAPISTARPSASAMKKQGMQPTRANAQPISTPRNPIQTPKQSTSPTRKPITQSTRASVQPTSASRRPKPSAAPTRKPITQPTRASTQPTSASRQPVQMPKQPAQTTKKSSSPTRKPIAQPTRVNTQPVSLSKQSDQTMKKQVTQSTRKNVQPVSVPQQPTRVPKNPVSTTKKPARTKTQPVSEPKQAVTRVTKTTTEQVPAKSEPVVTTQPRKDVVAAAKPATKAKNKPVLQPNRKQQPPQSQKTSSVGSSDPPISLSKRKINTVVPVSAEDQTRRDDLPPFDILQQRSGKVDPLEAQEKARLIEETLEDFGVPATVVEINQGPRITQFGVEPGFIETMQRDGSVKRRKVKVNAIKALSDDLALALAARSIRIQPRVPGRTYVGIELPNDEFETVTLHSVLTSEAYLKIKGDLVIALGRDVTGQPVAADISRMPHMLIAGATGSGKSVCINAIIASLLFNLGPDQLKLLLIDPKMVELVPYNGIPHLNTPVVTNMEKVVGSLSWAVREMERRYSLFSDARKRNLQSYNKWAKGSGHDTLPYIVIIIDELADLMMVAADEVEQIICRLAQMARATGIHLILATQRPSVDVVTGLIKANIPTRISFSVASGTDSRVILDGIGAEDLLGLGDMLYQASDASRLQRIQGCYVSDEELQDLVDYWLHAKAKKALSEIFQDKPPSTPIFQEQASSKTSNQDSKVKEESTDKLLAKAIALVEENQSISISVLQRKLRISYTRAARLIKELKKQGLIGGPKR